MEIIITHRTYLEIEEYIDIYSWKKRYSSFIFEIYLQFGVVVQRVHAIVTLYA